MKFLSLMAIALMVSAASAQTEEDVFYQRGIARSLEAANLDMRGRAAMRCSPLQAVEVGGYEFYGALSRFQVGAYFQCKEQE